jgi:hypothetical protein
MVESAMYGNTVNQQCQLFVLVLVIMAQMNRRRGARPTILRPRIARMARMEESNFLRLAGITLAQLVRRVRIYELHT